MLTGNIFPTSAGDSIFSFGLLTKLCEQNDVSLVTSVPSKNFEGINNLKIIAFKEPTGIFKHINRFIRSLTVSIIHPVGYKNDFEEVYDLVIIDHLRSYGILKSLPKRVIKKELLYIAHNVEYFNWLQKFRFEESFLSKIKNWINFGIRFNESQLVQASDSVHCLTEEDAYIIRNMYGKEKVFKTEVYFPFRQAVRDNVKKKSVLFLGSLEWFPNRHGVESFIQECVPSLDTQWSFHVVGSCPERIKKKYLLSNNIKFYGFEKDLDPFFETMAVLVVPNQFGTGIKMKIYEALQKGIPVIAIYESAVGYKESEDSNLHVVKTWTQLTQKLLHLEKKS